MCPLLEVTCQRNIWVYFPDMRPEFASTHSATLRRQDRQHSGNPLRPLGTHAWLPVGTSFWLKGDMLIYSLFALSVTCPVTKACHQLPECYLGSFTRTCCAQQRSEVIAKWVCGGSSAVGKIYDNRFPAVHLPCERECPFFGRGSVYQANPNLGAMAT